MAFQGNKPSFDNILLARAADQPAPGDAGRARLYITTGVNNLLKFITTDGTKTLADIDTAQSLTNKNLTSSSNNLSGATATNFTNGGTISLPSGTDTLVARSTVDALTNKNLTSSSNILSGATASHFTNGGTLTLPSGPDTIVGRVSADTLQNKNINIANGNTILGLTNSSIDAAAAIARTKLASGTANHVLINDGSGVMSSEALLNQGRGGTGFGTYTTGDLLYSNATNSLAKLPIGAGNQLLRVSMAGIPEWASIPGTGDINQNGNAFGTAMTIGTNDNFPLNLETNGTNKLSISTTGVATVGPSGGLGNAWHIARGSAVSSQDGTTDGTKAGTFAAYADVILAANFVRGTTADVALSSVANGYSRLRVVPQAVGSNTVLDFVVNLTNTSTSGGTVNGTETTILSALGNGTWSFGEATTVGPHNFLGTMLVRRTSAGAGVDTLTLQNQSNTANTASRVLLNPSATGLSRSAVIEAVNDGGDVISTVFKNSNNAAPAITGSISGLGNWVVGTVGTATAITHKVTIHNDGGTNIALGIYGSTGNNRQLGIFSNNITSSVGDFVRIGAGSGSVSILAGHAGIAGATSGNIGLDATKIMFSMDGGATNQGQLAASGAWTLGVSGGTQNHLLYGRMEIRNGASNDAIIGYYGNNEGTRDALIGTHGATGNLIAGGAVGDLAIRANNLKILFSTDDGASIQGKVESGAWALGAAGFTGTHDLNCTNLEVEAASGQTGGIAYLTGGIDRIKLHYKNSEGAPYLASNGAGLRFSTNNTTTTHGLIDAAGAWVVGATGSTEQHLINGITAAVRTSAGAGIDTLTLRNSSGSANTAVRIVLGPSTATAVSTDATARYAVIEGINDGGNSISTVFKNSNGGTPVETGRVSGAGAWSLNPTTGDGIYSSINRLFQIAETANFSVGASTSLTSTNLTTSVINASHITFVSATGAFDVHGVIALNSGTMLVINNNSGQTMTIKHESGTEGTATNRIRTRGAADVAFPSGSAAMLVYSNTRWFLIGS